MENRYSNFKYKHKHYNKRYYHSSSRSNGTHQNQYSKIIDTNNQRLNCDYNRLPTVVLQKIYSNLKLNDILNASATCSQWRLCLYDPLLWQNQAIYINLMSKNDLNSAMYKIKSFGSYCTKIIINCDPHDINLLLQLEILLEILVKISKNLQMLTFNPILNENSSYKNAQKYMNHTNDDTYNVEMVNKRLLKLICNLICKNDVKHLALGSFLAQDKIELANLMKSLTNKIISLHVASIGSSSNRYPSANINLPMFESLQSLSIDHECLNETFLRSITGLKCLNLNINDQDMHLSTSYSSQSWSNTWQFARARNPHLRVIINVIKCEDFGMKYDRILNKHMPLTALNMLFSKCLNQSVLNYVRDNYSESLKRICVIDRISDPTLRYHNPFRFDPDPLVLLAWKCKHLEELVLIGYEILEINLTAIAQLRTSLEIFHVPIDCVIQLRYGLYEDEDFIETESGDEVLVDYGFCSKQIIHKVSKALGYKWNLLNKYELPLSVYDHDITDAEAFVEILNAQQIPLDDKIDF